MAEGLTEFIRAAMRREFVWGEFDCILFCTDWVQITTGIDPAARWRGSYDSEASAQEIIDGFGSLTALCEEGYAGILELSAQQDAMVGVIKTPQGDTGAVRSGHSWVVLSEHGIGRLRHDVVTCVAAWRAPCQNQ